MDAFGIPAITWTDHTVDKFTVMVRAQDQSGAIKFFFIFFDGSRFVDYFGRSAGFREQPLPSGAPAIQSNPALEFVGPPLDRQTLYYRSGSRVYQLTGTVTAAGMGLVGNPMRAIEPSGAKPTLRGMPSVVGGVPMESGRHWVMSRDNNDDVWFAESFNDENIIP